MRFKLLFVCFVSHERPTKCYEQIGLPEQPELNRPMISHRAISDIATNQDLKSFLDSFLSKFKIHAYRNRIANSQPDLKYIDQLLLLDFTELPLKDLIPPEK
jgi:hypothetical protein